MPAVPSLTCSGMLICLIMNKECYSTKWYGVSTLVMAER
jgi:hypothetical protein